MSFDRNARSTGDVELRAIRAAVEHQAKSVLVTSLQAATRGRLLPQTIKFAEKVYKRTLIELVAHALVINAQLHLNDTPEALDKYLELAKESSETLLIRAEKWLALSECPHQRVHYNRARHLTALWQDTPQAVNVFFRIVVRMLPHDANRPPSLNHPEDFSWFLRMEADIIHEISEEEARRRAILAAEEGESIDDLFRVLEDWNQVEVSEDIKDVARNTYKSRLVMLTTDSLKSVNFVCDSENSSKNKGNRCLIDRVRPYLKKQKHLKRAEHLSFLWTEQENKVDRFLRAVETRDDDEIWKFIRIDANAEKKLICEFEYDKYLKLVDECQPEMTLASCSVEKCQFYGQRIGEIIRTPDESIRWKKKVNKRNTQEEKAAEQKEMEELVCVLANSLQNASSSNLQYEVGFNSELRSLKMEIRISDDTLRNQKGLLQFLQIRHGCAITGKPLRVKNAVERELVLVQRRNNLIKWMKKLHILRDAAKAPCDIRCDGAVEQLWRRIEALDRALRVNFPAHIACDYATNRFLALSEIAQFDPIVLPVLSRLRMFTRTPEFDSSHVQISDRSLKGCRLYELPEAILESLPVEIWDRRGVTVEHFMLISQKNVQVCGDDCRQNIYGGGKDSRWLAERWKDKVKPAWKPTYSNRASANPSKESIHPLLKSISRTQYDSKEFYSKLREYKSHEEARSVYDFLLEEKEAHYIDQCIHKCIVDTISDRTFQTTNTLEARVAAYEFVKDFISCALKGQRAYRMVPNAPLYLPGLARKLSAFLSHLRTLDPPSSSTVSTSSTEVNPGEYLCPLHSTNGNGLMNTLGADHSNEELRNEDEAIAVHKRKGEDDQEEGMEVRGVRNGVERLSLQPKRLKSEDKEKEGSGDDSMMGIETTLLISSDRPSLNARDDRPGKIREGENPILDTMDDGRGSDDEPRFEEPVNMHGAINGEQQHLNGNRLN